MKTYNHTSALSGGPTGGGMFSFPQWMHCGLWCTGESLTFGAEVVAAMTSNWPMPHRSAALACFQILNGSRHLNPH